MVSDRPETNEGNIVEVLPSLDSREISDQKEVLARPSGDVAVVAACIIKDGYEYLQILNTSFLRELLEGRAMTRYGQRLLKERSRTKRVVIVTSLVVAIVSPLVLIAFGTNIPIEWGIVLSILALAAMGFLSAWILSLRKRIRHGARSDVA
jgi:hypothetical protein